MEILSKFDKGGFTVVMLRSTYIKKVEDALAVKNFYQTFKSDPSSSLKNAAKKLCTDWACLDPFDHLKINRNINSEIDCSNLPRAYGLVKVHKVNFSIRIVVSTIESPVSLFDKSIPNLLKNYCEFFYYSIKNSFDSKKTLIN